MSRSIPRITAAALLAMSGAAIATVAFALVVAKMVLAAGLPGVHVRASDVALLDDLVPLTPFVAAFAAANLGVALAIVFDRTWADRVATAIATIATSLGAVAFVLVALGHDPFSARSSVTAVGDGLGIIAAFTLTYVVVIVLLALVGEPELHGRTPGRSLPAAA